jgi:hypothetical protein
MNDLVKVLVIFIRQPRLGWSSALRPSAVPVPLCSISRMGRKKHKIGMWPLPSGLYWTINDFVLEICFSSFMPLI